MFFCFLWKVPNSEIRNVIIFGLTLHRQKIKQKRKHTKKIVSLVMIARWLARENMRNKERKIKKAKLLNSRIDGALLIRVSLRWFLRPSFDLLVDRISFDNYRVWDGGPVAARRGIKTLAGQSGGRKWIEYYTNKFLSSAKQNISKC